MGSVSLINGHIDENKMTPKKASEVLEMFLHKQCDLKRTKFAYNANEVWEAVKKSSEALEKQIPKKGAYEYVSSYTDDDPVMICPCCQNSHPCEASNLYKYCFYCGQALDWSE